MQIGKIKLISFIILVIIACNRKTEEFSMLAPDPHSYSNPVVARVVHLNWNATANLGSKTIEAVATWTIQAQKGAKEIVFDTKDLYIQKVIVDDKEIGVYEILEKDSILGAALKIAIESSTQKISIHYITSSQAEALQWLDPEQTQGSDPFLFTQSQAILARSWIPCQDSPGIRFTYDATVTVPKQYLALMSAENNPTEINKTGIYHFKMSHPIPSYLMSLAVGKLAYKPLSDRCGVYAEPPLLPEAAWEFADLEKMVKGAEQLYGDYKWGRYDVLVLPPSFPFGGMENPCLTFATPTILAGDRSLTSLIAHELAHSWSGNLVTNATWSDFWLNEGFTVYFETRIMEKLYGEDNAEMLAALNYQSLLEEIQSLKASNQEDDTKLKLNLKGRSPDDGVTEIAYNKGYFFIRQIEETYGREKLDKFLSYYFDVNSFGVMTSEAFVKTIQNYYEEQFQIKIPQEFFDKWIYSTGLPENCPYPTSVKFEMVDKMLADWVTTGKADPIVTSHWTTQEWLHFLNNLPEDLTVDQMKKLDSLGHFTQSGNAEIIAVWSVLSTRTKYEPAFDKIRAFLMRTGRRKFLIPIYTEMLKTKEGKEVASEIYAKARYNYHFVARNSLDKLFAEKNK